jgi:hypothetical protein
MYASQYPLIGAQSPNYWFLPDTNQRDILGQLVNAADAFWGGAELIYGQAGGTIAANNLCVYSGAFSFTTCPNTANQGRPVAVAMAAMTVGQYGWFFISGAQVPITASASVAAGSLIGITGAGTVGAVTAGKQLESAVSSAPSSTTVVKTNVQTQAGSPVIVTQGYDGWFPGVTITGTGVSGTVANVSSDGRTVTLSANATATGSVTVTGTYTGFILATIDRAAVEGQIT